MRRLLQPLTAVPLLLCGAVCVLWGLSYRRPDTLHREWNDSSRLVYREDYVVSADGLVWVQRHWRSDPPLDYVISFHRACQRRRSERPWHGWQHLSGFSLETPLPRNGWERAGFYSQRSGRQSPPSVRDYHLIAVPYWAIAAGSLTPLAVRPVARSWRPLRRRRRGNVCRGCGYDLTGNVSGVCPECGRAR
jgi:hypothetical protein